MICQLVAPHWLAEVLPVYRQVLGDLLWFALAFGAVTVVGLRGVVPLAARAVRSRNRNNPTIETATKTYLRVLLIGLAILAGLIAAGYGRILSDSAVVIAAITFALGIAGQEVFGSLVSGLFLVADPDFNVGDWIEWPDGEGTIEAVDFRVTRVRTPDNETIAVPNTDLTANTIARPYGRSRYRVRERVYVSYGEDTERSLWELREIATALDGVLEEPPPTTRIVELGTNAITIQAEFWIDEPMEREIRDLRSDFRREVKGHFDAEDITLAPPAAQLLSGSVVVTGEEAESHAGGGR
ncbi:MAG: mechanosensitive ion channel family protein [Halanaeroarchaeum sp.]